MNAITYDDALGVVREMSGLPGYPFHAEGETRLANILREHAINMDHGLYVVERFNEWTPTPLALTDALLNEPTRVRFHPEPKPDPEEQKRAEWRAELAAEGTEPDPVWSAGLVLVAAAGVVSPDGHGVPKKLETGEFKRQLAGMHRQAIRDMLFYTEFDGRGAGDRIFWQLARESDLKKHPDLAAEVRGEMLAERQPKVPRDGKALAVGA